MYFNNFATLRSEKWYSSKFSIEKVKKVIVFDLDETIGSFSDFILLLKYIKKQKKVNISQELFNKLLDLYPEFLRPNIINILSYLKKKKQKNCCDKMLIYTNNNGPKEWSHHIIKYFEKKIEYKLIDQLISAFKIDGKTVEICRTSHNKTHQDLIKCTKIPATAEICFLDDTFYPEMTNDNIYYINIKPYYYDLQFDYMIEKFKESNIGIKLINSDLKNDFDSKMLDNIKLYNYECIDKDSKEYEIDKILGKHIIMHLQYFFNKTKKNKTIRNRLNRTIKNKTIRK